MGRGHRATLIAVAIGLLTLSNAPDARAQGKKDDDDCPDIWDLLDLSLDQEIENDPDVKAASQALDNAQADVDTTSKRIAPADAANATAQTNLANAQAASTAAQQAATAASAKAAASHAAADTAAKSGAPVPPGVFATASADAAADKAAQAASTAAQAAATAAQAAADKTAARSKSVHDALDSAKAGRDKAKKNLDEAKEKAKKKIEDRHAPPPGACKPPGPALYLAGIVGGNLFTVGMNTSTPTLPGSLFAPGLRVGVLLKPVALALDVRYLALLGSGDTALHQGALTFGPNVSAFVWKAPAVPLRVYVHGGFDLGGAFFSDPTAGVQSYLTGGFSVGAGAMWRPTHRWLFGIEAGFRAQFTRGPTATEATGGLFVDLFGGAILKQEKGGHPTTGQGGDQPPPTTTGDPTQHTGTAPPKADPGDINKPQDPSDTDKPPTIYGHDNKGCRIVITNGWLEPTQGVWQDDATFADAPGKRLTRKPGAPPRYTAELPMVVGRHSVLMGVEHYLEGDKTYYPASRQQIHFEGVTDCSTAVAVKAVFKLNGAELDHAEIYPTTLPFAGAPGKPSPWTADVYVGAGQRATENGFVPFTYGLPRGKTFTFAEGDYELTADLTDSDGKEYGLNISVKGKAVKVEAPRVVFVALAAANPLVEQAKQLAQAAKAAVPDFWPLVPNGLPVESREPITLDMGPAKDDYTRKVAELRDTPSGAGLKDWDQLPAEAQLAYFASYRLQLIADIDHVRVVALMKAEDWKQYHPTDTFKDSTGAQTTNKVTLAPIKAGMFTIGHELGHTVPVGWMGPDLPAECTPSDYHNKSFKWAHGLRITTASADGARDLMDDHMPMMGSNTDIGVFTWITQCTYWHLVNQLQHLPDPALILARGTIWRSGGGTELAAFGDLYDLMGEASLAAGTGGAYALVLRAGDGRELARYPFAPARRPFDTDRDYDVIGFSERVPAVAGAARLELVGAGGVLAARELLAAVPSLQISAPADGARVKPAGGRVHVAWTAASSAANRTLRAIVQYSSDGGRTWSMQGAPAEVSAAEVTLARGASAHRVKITVTDGSRSSEATVAFTAP